MDIKAQALFSEMQLMAAQSQLGIPQTGIAEANLLQQNPSAQNFAEMLGDAINGVNARQLESRSMQQRFDMGDKTLSLADVMVAKEKSGIAFEATVQVRNKVMEAYKQIMNMPV